LPMKGFAMPVTSTGIHHRPGCHYLSSFFALVCSDTEAASDSIMLLVMSAVSVMFKLLVNVVI
jgi:hypothetical protein